MATTELGPLDAPAKRQRARSTRRFTGPLIGATSIVVALAAWWLLTTGIKVVPPLYFPPPAQVLTAAQTLSTTLAADAGATLLRVLVSWAVGSIAGIIVGLAMSRWRLLFYALTPLVEAVRPIPPVALIPFVILWFGIGDNGKIFLGALACFMVMLVNTIVASGNVNPIHTRAARSLGASNGQVYRGIVLPAIVPELLSGLRIGSALAFAVVVAAEFLGADTGVGRLIMQASRTLDSASVLVGTIVIALEAVVVDRLIKFGSDRLTRWADR